jgi:hypothetical protein
MVSSVLLKRLILMCLCHFWQVQFPGLHSIPARIGSPPPGRAAVIQKNDKADARMQSFETPTAG